MSKRKFVKNGEKPNSYRCIKQKCKWEGKDEEKKLVPFSIGYELVCPKCGCNTFYGLL